MTGLEGFISRTTPSHQHLMHMLCTWTGGANLQTGLVSADNERDPTSCSRRGSVHADSGWLPLVPETSACLSEREVAIRTVFKSRCWSLCCCLERWDEDDAGGDADLRVSPGTVMLKAERHVRDDRISPRRAKATLSNMV